MRDPKKSYWGFPKGHINPEESSKDAALREVKEETGLVCEIKEKLGDSRYVFTYNGEKIFKVVVMFLMEYKSGELVHQQEELLDAKWFDPEDALVVLSFSKDKVLLKKALEMRHGQ
jgi:8-oxo-dGTP pyrophosphatase MutT (NUDIX family)